MAGEYGDEVWKDDGEVRTVHGEKYPPWKSFNDCCGPWKFPDGLMQFLIEQGFKCPTPIQANTWPPLLDGKDVIGVAKTGSGKTLGYLLPGYIKVKRQEMKEGCSCEQSKGPMMLVCAPTRELCQQIFDESDKFGRPAQIATVCVYGGAPRQQQVRNLWNGPQCVVATPGRLNDFIRDGSVKLGQILYWVLDEADRMLDMGFEPQVKEMAQYIPAERQTALFTATWPREVRAIAGNLTRDATHIQVGSADSATTNSDITQHIIKIRGEGDKLRYLETEIFPKLQSTGGACLVFTRTKKAASQLYSTLSRAGAPIVCLHGDMEQRERDNALWNFKQGKAKLLVATDVAQRGLDIKNVACVVNYDPADNMEAYVHRIGRTGRAGETGDAYTFLYENDRTQAQQIATVMKKSGQQVPANLQEILGGSGYGGGGKGGGYGGGGGHGGGNLDGSWGGKYASGGGGGGGGYGR